MKKNFNKSERGFTIIEVVLVLAIGGLIFMVVFLALPGLQANQRDTQRRQVLGSAVSAMVTYQSNNKGKLPAAVPAGAPTDFFQEWVGSSASFAEPRTSSEYLVKELPATTTETTVANQITEDNIIYFAKAVSGKYPQCKADGSIYLSPGTATGETKNSFVMTVLLDSGKQAYCQAS